MNLALMETHLPMASETIGSGSMDVEALAALEQFVVNNDDLLELESRIGKFNIFDALSIARTEIRHSNFLAFILDPTESHGQGQLFLKGILMDLLKKAPQNLRPLSPIDLDGIDLRGVEVEREWKNIDILITCKEPPFAIVIENKVDSQDHSKQLDRYSDEVRKSLLHFAPLFVYLTPDGDDTSEETKETWLSYKYADIFRVLRRVRATYLNAIGDEVLVFLDHYLELLETRFMNDEKLDELCRRIYKNHRLAIDLIWERAKTPASSILDVIQSQLKEDQRWHIYQCRSNWVTFVPKEWLGWLKYFEQHPDDDPLHLSIFWSYGRLYLCVEVGPMADQSKRTEIVKKLIDNTSTFDLKPRKSAKLTAETTRVFGQEHVADVSEENDVQQESLRKSVKSKLDEIYRKLEKLPAVLKPLYSLSSSGN